MRIFKIFKKCINHQLINRKHEIFIYIELFSNKKYSKDLLSNLLTFRKNNPPDNSKTLWEPGNIFNGTPSLYHCIVGVGDPSALQFNVAGSCFGIIESVGCSMIFGGWNPVKIKKSLFENRKNILLNSFVICLFVKLLNYKFKFPFVQIKDLHLCNHGKNHIEITMKIFKFYFTPPL